MVVTKKPRIASTLEQLASSFDPSGCPANEELLEELLALTRSVTADLRSLASPNALSTLSQYAFHSSSPKERSHALRSMNNAIVYHPPQRQAFVDAGYPTQVIGLLKQGSPDDELATLNILIFCSASTTLDVLPFLEHHDLAGIVNKNIARHAKDAHPLADPASPSAANLRLLSTIATKWEAEAHRFLPSAVPILEILRDTPIPSPPMQFPITTVLGCLASIPLERVSGLTAATSEKLVDILHPGLSIYGNSGKENELLPLLMALLRVSQSNSTEAKDRLSDLLVPSNTDREQPLGKGQTLPHRLLKLSSDSLDAKVRDLVMAMHFELAGRDPSRLVNNVGFGHAAGFLAAQGIQMTPQDLAKGNTSTGDVDINPITGQKVDKESQSDLPQMTDEEKEREAERLFVLFERLRATGVVDIQNPVAQAVQSGRIQELPDDDNSSDKD